METKNFLLTFRTQELVDILPESMVGYYNGTESLIDQVARYSTDDALRKRMAERAYKEVISKHTFTFRFKEMFKFIGV